MKDMELQKRIENAVDTTLVSLDLSSDQCDTIVNTVREKGKKQNFNYHHGGYMKPRFSLALVLVIILLLITVTAVATNYSYVVQYLFPKNKESMEHVEEFVQDIDIVQNGKATTVVKDALLHDNQLSIGLSFASDQPLYIVTNSISVDGVPIEISQSSVEGQWINGEIAPSDAVFGIHGLTLDLENVPISDKEQSVIRLQMILLAPNKEVTPVDIYADNTEDAWHQIDSIVSAGMTPISADEPYELLVGSGWMIANDYDLADGIQHPLDAITDFVKYSNVTVADEIDVTFTIIPDIQY